mgnify:FL=1
MWWLKLSVCIAYDLFDMTLGRLLFVVPFSGELVGVALCCALFGKSGVWAAIECLDPTEQLDGFIPIATIIALVNRPARELAVA